MQGATALTMTVEVLEVWGQAAAAAVVVAAAAAAAATALPQVSSTALSLPPLPSYRRLNPPRHAAPAPAQAASVLLAARGYSRTHIERPSKCSYQVNVCPSNFVM